MRLKQYTGDRNMKAIILAAGKGTRISQMSNDQPKSVLSINGTPLIRITIDKLMDANITPIVVTGYNKESVVAAISSRDVIYYNNPFYDVTNSIASLWFAREQLSGDDLIIMNADVFFENKILTSAIHSDFDVALVSDKSRINEGDYFLTLAENGCIKSYGKNMPLNERSCEYVGIGKISASFLNTFTRQLEYLISEQKHTCWWEDVLYSLVEKEYNINTIDTNGEFWSEIDYWKDYERILNYVQKKHHGKG